MKFVSQFTTTQTKLCIKVFFIKDPHSKDPHNARMVLRMVPNIHKCFTEVQIHIKCDSLHYNCFVNNLYENSNLM